MSTTQSSEINCNENQKVLTMTNYWDGPLLGVANLFERPHIYERRFNTETDDYDNFYYLKPIHDKQFLNLILESWAMWERYLSLDREGKLGPEDVHPCLAIDRKRHDELEELFKLPHYSQTIHEGELERVIKAHGKFSRRAPGETKPEFVHWTKIEYGSEYSVLYFLPDFSGVIKRENLPDVQINFQDEE